MKIQDWLLFSLTFGKTIRPVNRDFCRSYVKCIGLVSCISVHLGVFVKSTHQVLIDLPANAMWNQTAILVAGDGIAGLDNSHLNQPDGIDIYSDDALLISDTNNNRIIRFEQGKFKFSRI
jgi:hypothetical protein